MYKLPVIVAYCLVAASCVIDTSSSSTVVSVTIPAVESSMEVRLLSDEDEAALHNMAKDPHVALAGDSQLYHYDYTPQHQQKPLLDHTWVPEVTQVEPGLLVGVTLSWDPRGWEGVEYLVSWAEEGGMVSGHLVTKDTQAEVSLWPAMKYYIQIELLDFQGNTMMKSHASPVIFQKNSIGTTTTPTPSTTQTPVEHSITTTESPRPSSVSHFYSTFSPSSTSSKLSSTFSQIATSTTTPATTRAPTTTPVTTTAITSTTTLRTSTSTTTDLPTTILPNMLTSDSPIDIINTQRNNIEESQNVPFPNEVRNEVIIDYPSRIQVLEAFETRRDDDARVEVLQVFEVDAPISSTSSTSAMVVWGAGVTMGALLVLCLCVLALWVLRKSRKTKVPEYLEESVISSNLSSSEKGDNQIKSSWRFETFAGSPSKEHLVSSYRDSPPCGIDNASLVENYLVVCENPYHSRPLPPLPPVRELRY